ncbi:flagellar basal body protein [Sulfurimonas sp.]|nr:flagellar basal body protein [Sulfurimonas sp.]
MNISSIQAHQTMLNTSANNIANVNTDKFRPNDTRIVENQNSVTAYNTKVDDSGSTKSQTDLAKEIPDQIVAQDATSVNVSAIKTQDEMFGTLLDIKA